MLKPARYALSDLPSPQIKGLPLNGLVRGLETWPFLRSLILSQNNFKQLRRATYTETPLLLPFPPVALADRERQKPQRLLTDPHPVSDPIAASEDLLQRIQKSNEGPQPLRAFIEVDSAGLRAAARESQLRLQDGRRLSPLDGVPIAIKSEIHVHGLHAKAGTNFLAMPADHPEATLVQRLRAAGALIPGLTNMHEIGIGVTGANIHEGPARNPIDRRRHTGGSSSGSAAAVAAGLVPIAIGADGGGSVRIPAALCGLVGLKPTFGRVSGFGTFPSCLTLCQPGPMAATARDCALAYQVIAGPDPLDTNTHRQPPVTLRGFDDIEDLSDLTVGVYSPWFEHADAEVVSLCNEMLVTLQKRGLKLIEISIPDLEEVRLAHFATIAAEMHHFMRTHLQRNKHQLAATTRFALALGSGISAEDYLQAQRVRQRAIHHLLEIFNSVDLIASPTCAITAPLIKGPDVLDTRVMGQLMRFAQLYNLTGNPAISFPAGTSGQGLPVGIQFAARWWAEADLLRLANAAEHYRGE